MKKIYLSIIALLLLSTTKAQISQHIPDGVIKIGDLGLSKQIVPTIGATEKTLGQAVKTWDFTNTADWIIDNSGQTAADLGWSISSTSKITNVSAIKSKSGGNFAQLFNGSTTNPTNVKYTLTTAAPIDITSLAGTNNVTLSFLQYGAKFKDNQEVYISTDGTNFTLVGDNSDIPPLYSNSGSAYANPTLKTIDLAKALVSGATSVWFRFSWTSVSTSTVSPWYTYGWLIDDVSVNTKSDFDLEQKKVLFGSIGAYGSDQGDISYFKIPITQISPIDFGGVIKNNGSSSQSDVIFNTNATGYPGVSAPASIASGVTDTVWVANKYIHDGTIGSKIFTFNTSSSAVDDVPANNGTTASAQITINFTDNIYARDNGSKDGFYDNNGKKYELANVFDVFADQTLYSIDVTLDKTTAINTSFYAIVYELTQTGRVELVRSEVITVTSAMIGKNITLELSNPQLLSAGKPYYIGVGSEGGNGTDLVVATAGKSNPGTSFIKDETDTWFYITTTPMIRMNFQNATGLSELKTVSSLNIYPNPANISANVSFELNNDTDVNIAVSDLTGKTVYSNKLGNMNSGSHNVTINTDKMSNGIYIVNFEANGTTTSQKLVVRK